MIEQGSEEWKQLRLGKVTASRIADLMAKVKSGGFSAGRTNYMAELVCERLTGQPTEGFKSADMEYGNQVEDEARSAYCFFNNVTIEEVPFVEHASIAMAGASPDGLIGDKGLFEVKCPKPATHIATLEGKKIKGVYLKQMQWQMACTGREWCDFVSYCNIMPENLQLSVTRIKRDELFIDDVECHVIDFLADVADKVQFLQELNNIKGA